MMQQWKIEKFLTLSNATVVKIEKFLEFFNTIVENRKSSNVPQCNCGKLETILMFYNLRHVNEA